MNRDRRCTIAFNEIEIQALDAIAFNLGIPRNRLIREAALWAARLVADNESPRFRAGDPQWALAAIGVAEVAATRKR